jgi:uncharacterized delta-60 repeat protein
LVRLTGQGILDSTFGEGGKVSTGFQYGIDWPESIKIQPDGRIVLGGYRTEAPPSGQAVQTAFARYNGDGTLDPSFGEAGGVTSNSLEARDFVYDLALQADGRILSAGGTAPLISLNPIKFGSQDFALFRLNADGSSDCCFGSQGKVTTDFRGGGDHARALAIHAYGKVIAAGPAFGGLDSDFGLVRYNIDGTIDTNFGAQGKVLTDFSPPSAQCGNCFTTSNDQAHALVIQKDGKIVVVGQTTYNNQTDFALARYHAVIPEPQAAIGELNAGIDSLVARGMLDPGNGNALESILQSAISSMEGADQNAQVITNAVLAKAQSAGKSRAANNKAAANKLGAFINMVEALVRSGRLTEEAGARALIDMARLIIAALN